MNDTVAAAKAASEQRYPALNADEDILSFTRGQIRAMLRGAFQAGASWTLTRKDHQ
ncbi:hypothetical protein OR221_0841 [Microbacterium laevaniformans OR221]|nr:hypothetical protein OR221_0841 [Microbacterium laevaniformans OR221]